MRPNMDVDQDTVEAVDRYAETHGLRRSRAWADLVRAGLEAEGVEVK